MTHRQQIVNVSRRNTLNRIEQREIRYEKNEDFEHNVIAVLFMEALRVRAKVKKSWYEYPSPLGGIVQR